MTEKDGQRRSGRCFDEVTSEKDEEPGEKERGRPRQAEGVACAKACSGKDLARCANSWCARYRASKGRLAQARLAWEAGSSSRWAEM